MIRLTVLLVVWAALSLFLGLLLMWGLQLLTMRVEYAEQIGFLMGATAFVVGAIWGDWW